MSEQHPDTFPALAPNQLIELKSERCTDINDAILGVFVKNKFKPGQSSVSKDGLTSSFDNQNAALPVHLTYFNADVMHGPFRGIARVSVRLTGVSEPLVFLLRTEGGHLVLRSRHVETGSKEVVYKESTIEEADIALELVQNFTESKAVRAVE